QVAAGTLDASAKIYAVRVDSIHADTYRVLGGLGKDSAPPKDLESPEEGEQFSLFLS
ncbi:CND2 protein, partial [Malurus elegans]|nr:CND2 protein [Malurus elegans]